jgi:GT2 family glycosyltransferase
MTALDSSRPAPKVSAVVVSYSDPEATARAVQSLLDQTRAPDQVLVVDNDPSGATRAARTRLGIPAQATILHTGENLGYTGAANLAAASATGDWLFFLNPDARADPDCLAHLLQAGSNPSVGIVGAQILLPDGRINAGDNPVNLAGLSWSGRYGEPRERQPPRDTAAVSGAALLVRRDAFCALGGLCQAFFLYFDDTDLAWRARLAGWRVAYCSEAVVVHDYEFDKGSRKWFYLERNRGWAVLSNYELRTLIMLVPLLLAVEAAVVLRATSEGWLAEKLAAWVSIGRNLPAILRWRRTVQAGRRVPDRDVLSLFSGAIRTPLVESALLRRANPWLERYRHMVLALLGAPQ